MAKELGIVLAVDDEEGEGEASKHYYAPIDRPLTTLTEVGIASDRGWGLGYVPNPSIAHATAAGPSSRGMSGVEMDEDEVYGAEPAAFGSSGGKKRNFMVDLDEDDGDDHYTIRGTGNRRADPTPSKVSLPLQSVVQMLTSIEQKSKSASKTESFHDNTPVIPGFRIHRDDNAVASRSVRAYSSKSRRN